MTETHFFWNVTLCRWASFSLLSDQFYIITVITVIVNIVIIVIIMKGYGFCSLRLVLLDPEDALKSLHFGFGTLVTASPKPG